MLYACMKSQALDGKHRLTKAQELNNKSMPDPMLLEQKMAGCSEETADIFESQENHLCLKMMMLQFRIQL